ncbi:MAG: molybdopterin-dependent oxidoreductase [Proteobacteria bacterium]|nr:molybdopterin-dependent oxidoreductase [Pseudomonadota bacterium]MBU4470571.1 molybdopterin-dependent oxidoreductase [Pseudomonadota bacterium]MCG2751407.1 molybdopterin-dependent oxidoreductase [Desulfobacteraceae bacterium]
MTESQVQIVRTICNSHCGGTCEMKVHVQDNKIIRIEPDDRPGHPRMCARGHAYRQRVYAPDRLLYPMKRTGPRGSGEFVRISWDEAAETIATELQKVKAAYGNAAILHFCSMCDPHTLHHVGAFHRLLCQFGGYTAPWGFISHEGATFAAGLTYGTRRKYVQTEHSADEYASSKFLIMWGWNPATTDLGSLTNLALAMAREQGTRIVTVDPRFTDSAAVFADQWIPIRPGTDAAVLLSMAYVVMKENLQDQAFIDKYTLGYEPFKAYVLGEEDGVEKTPQWASIISGIPAETIAKLAREFATNKPATLVTSIGPGRTAMGEQYHRAAHALEAITGNTAFANWQSGPSRNLKFNPQLPSPPNAVEEGMPPRNIALPYRSRTVNSSARVNVSSFANAILKGKAGGYAAEYKAIWLSNTNYLNQLGDVNTTAKAFEKLDFALVTEQFMTPTARFADIVLPVCTFLERHDIVAPRGGQVFAILNKAIEPLGESKSQREICQLLAKKLGIEDYGDASDEEMVKNIIEQASEEVDLPDFETLKKEGMHRVKRAVPPGLQKDSPKAPGDKPLKTPSGKIEIYSEVALNMNQPQITALPKYIETWEGLNDPLAQKYPLQLISPHLKRRAHTQFDNLPWLRELQIQAVSMNTVDAGKRGIQQGEMVRVFNDRGEVRIPAKVTERIMPGVVALPQGAWYTPDEKGIDHGGCVNVLTKNEISPGGAFACHTALVQIEKVVE